VSGQQKKTRLRKSFDAQAASILKLQRTIRAQKVMLKHLDERCTEQQKTVEILTAMVDKLDPCPPSEPQKHIPSF